MISNEVYLDYNATAPVKPPVILAMTDAMATVGNPSSVHAAGRAARRLVERARAQVAALVGVPPEAVIFTSGGTEANNQALASVPGTVLTSAIEHDSVLRAAGDLPQVGVDSAGQLDLPALEAVLDRHAPAALAIMLANNETGVVQPVRAAAEMAQKRGVCLHVDAVQAAGKIFIDFFELGAASLSLSAHKLGGPQGIGALVVRPGAEPRAILKGGAQERRLRAGTENVPGIVGFGAAAELALADLSFADRIGGFRDRMEAEIMAMAPEARVYGVEAPRLPNTSCLTMPGVSHETQLIAFDLAGIAVSSGSACSSGKVGPSHVLAAMGVPAEEAETAIRISFGWGSREADVDRFIKAYADLLERRRARRSVAEANRPAAGYG